MSNILSTIGHDIKVGVVDVGKFLVDAPSIIAKFGSVLEAEKAVEPSIVTAAKQVLADGLAFESAAAKAVNDKGLVWTEDTAAIAAATGLRTSIPALVAALSKAVTAAEQAAK